MIIGIVATVALSIYNSYTRDFQPQGRYCYPAFLALAILITKGYETLIYMFKKKEHVYAVTSAVCTSFICMSIYVYATVYLPS